MIDVAQERIAIREANKLGIPVIGVVDTNCSPNGIDYIIPGNDDALSAIEYYMSCAASVVESARKVFESEQSKLAKQALPKISKKPAARVVAKSEEAPVEKKPAKESVKAEAAAKSEEGSRRKNGVKKKQLLKNSLLMKCSKKAG